MFMLKENFILENSDFIQNRYSNMYFLPYIFNGYTQMPIDPRYYYKNELLNDILIIKQSPYIHLSNVIVQDFHSKIYGKKCYLKEAMEYSYNKILDSEMAFDKNKNYYTGGNERTEEEVRKEIDNFYSLINNEMLMDFFFCLTSQSMLYYESLDKIRECLSSKKSLLYLFEIVKALGSLTAYYTANLDISFKEYDIKFNFNIFKHSFYVEEIDFAQLSC